MKKHCVYAVDIAQWSKINKPNQPINQPIFKRWLREDKLYTKLYTNCIY